MSNDTTTTLTGHDAIAYAETHGLILSKYADPTEGAREGLSVDEAREIAREDASLIWLKVVTSIYESDGSDGYTSGTWGYVIRSGGSVWCDGGCPSREIAAEKASSHRERLGA